MTAFIDGLIAGYGIAIPVGAIAILIIESALRHGIAVGFSAGGQCDCSCFSAVRSGITGRQRSGFAGHRGLRIVAAEGQG